MRGAFLTQGQSAVGHAQCKSQLVSPQQPSHTVAAQHRPRVRVQCSHQKSYARNQKALIAQASSLDEGLSTSTSSLLGPSVQSQSTNSSREAVGNVADVELATEVGQIALRFHD